MTDINEYRDIIKELLFNIVIGDINKEIYNSKLNMLIKYGITKNIKQPIFNNLDELIEYDIEYLKYKIQELNTYNIYIKSILKLNKDNNLEVYYSQCCECNKILLNMDILYYNPNKYYCKDCIDLTETYNKYIITEGKLHEDEYNYILNTINGDLSESLYFEKNMYNILFNIIPIKCCINNKINIPKLIDILTQFVKHKIQ